MSEVEAITQMLLECREGGEDVVARLMPLLYDDLRRLARRQRRSAGGGETLNTTGLVHEAYLRLVDQTQVEWQDRNHFMAVAARAMRFILIDHARRRYALKRGAGKPAIPLADNLVVSRDDALAFLDLDLSLERLEKHDPRLVRVVECRFFAGLTEQETGDALGISRKTVQRDWKRARGWLKADLPEMKG